MDAETKEPLAFVSINLKGANKGAISDIDGKWQVGNASPNDSIIFSLVGFKSLHLTVNQLSQRFPSGLILLSKAAYNLKEVTVKAGENPAHRIIRKALLHKKQNNYERLSSYSYTTYNRFHVTRDKLDSVQAAEEKERRKDKKGSKISIGFGSDSTKDSLKNRNSNDSFFNAQHIFIVESVTEKKFKYPDKVKEIVRASKVSGSIDPRFSLIATEYNDFNIYKDFIEVDSKKYLSPLAYDCISKYFFNLEDSLISEKDTVYVIAYRPRRNSLFNGFSGLIYINTQNYAVQNVIALPKGLDQGLNTEVQEQFNQIEGHWFPEQINYKIVLGGTDGNRSSLLAVVGRGKSYIKEVQINPEIKNRTFNDIAVEIDKKAGNKSDTFWAKSRKDTLTKQDKQTYKVIDSVGKALHLDRKIKYLEALLSGRIGVGIFDIPLRQLLDYNGYEGYRVGTGLYTNDKLSPYFSVGGYGAYGTKDKVWKYGGEAFLTPIIGSPFRIAAGYYKDLQVLGGVRYPMDRDENFKEPIHNLNIYRMSAFERKQVSIRFSPFRYLTLEPMYRQSIEKVKKNYHFLESDGELNNTFSFTEASLGIRYAYKEKFMQTLDKRYSLGTHYPIFWANITQGFNNGVQGQFAYRKYDAKMEKSFSMPLLGYSQFQLRGGFVDGTLPLVKMYNGNGNRADFPIMSQNTFETMHPYEFFSSRYAAVFFSHSFEKLLIKLGKYQPILKVYSNAGIGTIDHSELHKEIQFKTMEKGYYESGVSVENFLTKSFDGMGIALYYRYGPCSDPKPKNNILLKFVFTLTLFGDK